IASHSLSQSKSQSVTNTHSVLSSLTVKTQLQYSSLSSGSTVHATTVVVIASSGGGGSAVAVTKITARAAPRTDVRRTMIHLPGLGPTDRRWLRVSPRCGREVNFAARLWPPRPQNRLRATPNRPAFGSDGDLAGTDPSLADPVPRS